MMQSKHTDQGGNNISSKSHQFIHIVFITVPGGPRSVLKRIQKKRKDSESTNTVVLKWLTFNKHSLCQALSISTD